MPPKKIHRSLGPNATVSALIRHVHPRNFFKELYPDAEEYKSQRWSFLVEALREGDQCDLDEDQFGNVRHGVKGRKGDKGKGGDADSKDGRIWKGNGEKRWLILRHEDHPDLTFWAFVHHIKFVKAGPSKLFFSLTEPDYQQQDCSDEDSLDDENNIEPVEDGLSRELDESNDVLPLASEWRWGPWQELHAHDSRGMMPKSDAIMNVGPFGDTRQWAPIQYFDAFFPWGHVIEEVIPATNERLNFIFKTEMTLEEFKVYLGIWMVMSLNMQYPQKDFFVSPEKKARTGIWNPPYLGDYMAETRFETIHSCLRLVKGEKMPSYRDRLWRARPLVEALNNQMESNFHPSWITTLGQCELQPNKNQKVVRGKCYQAMACANTEIIFRLEIIETKEERPQEGPNSTADYEAEMGILPSTAVRLTKPTWGSQRVVLLDSKFCHLQCLCELHKKGLFASALITEKSQWPEGIDREEIEEFLGDKDVGYHGLFTGQNDQYPSVPLWVGTMVDSKHVGIIANTWSTNLPMGNAKKRKVGDDVVDVKYGEYQHWYYFGRDAILHHNQARQANPSFEEFLSVDRWELSHFAFALSLVQVNAMKAFNNFTQKLKGKEFVTKASFVYSVANDLITSTSDEDMEDSTTPPQKQAAKESNDETGVNSSTSGGRKPVDPDAPSTELVLPEGAKIASIRDNKKLTVESHVLCRMEPNYGKWNGFKFPKIKTSYSRSRCAFRCGQETRTFCSCNFSLMLCARCHGNHVLQMESEEADTEE